MKAEDCDALLLNQTTIKSLKKKNSIKIKIDTIGLLTLYFIYVSLLKAALRG